MSGTTVQFLGTGDAFGSGGRMQTSILVSGNLEGDVLIDCGATAVLAMNQYQVNPNRISTILLSHLHGDHTAGIPFFILDAQFNTRRTEPLTIIGPEGTKAWYGQVMETLFPGSASTKQKFSLQIRETVPDNEEAVSERITAKAFRVLHTDTLVALAWRLQFGDTVIAYSGDTEWVPSLVKAAEKADLYITECYFYDKKVKNHLDYRTIEEHLPEITAKRVILTHMGGEMLARLPDIEAETAKDGMKIFL